MVEAYISLVLTFNVYSLPKLSLHFFCPASRIFMRSYHKILPCKLRQAQFNTTPQRNEIDAFCICKLCGVAHWTISSHVSNCGNHLLRRVCTLQQQQMPRCRMPFKRYSVGFRPVRVNARQTSLPLMTYHQSLLCIFIFSHYCRWPYMGHSECLLFEGVFSRYITIIRPTIILPKTHTGSCACNQ